MKLLSFFLLLFFGFLSVCLFFSFCCLFVFVSFFYLFAFLFFCLSVFLSFCLSVFLSRHHSDKMTEGSQVSKFTLCVKFQNRQWVSESVTDWPRPGIELTGKKWDNETSSYSGGEGLARNKRYGQAEEDFWVDDSKALIVQKHKYQWNGTLNACLNLRWKSDLIKRLARQVAQLAPLAPAQGSLALAPSHQW